MELFSALDPKLQPLDASALEQTRDAFARFDDIAAFNQRKVLGAFIKNKISAELFAGSTGYGYGDRGRDTLDRLFADIAGAEDALCRAQFMSGTHAITVALYGLLRPGDTLLCVTGQPYDTLLPVIGIGGSSNGSLLDFGVVYQQIELLGGAPDLAAIERQAEHAAIVYVQRSRGYTNRRALSLEDIAAIADAAKSANPNALVVVDNCYGEFTQKKEPTEAGADLMMGSLLKNPGGGIAETGGYIAGRADLVERCAERLTAPGVGREIGSWPGGLRNLYLGLYLAPGIVAQALKTAAYAAALLPALGFPADPIFDAERNDIITSIEMGDPDALVALCRAIQAFSPIDSFAAPEPAEMPGYDEPVVMASGSFTNGSSIELSCDAPMRAPYTAYMQGGLSFEASRFALLGAAQHLLEAGFAAL